MVSTECNGNLNAVRVIC